RPLAVAPGALVGGAPGIGNDTVEPALVGLGHTVIRSDDSICLGAPLPACGVGAPGASIRTTPGCPGNRYLRVSIIQLTQHLDLSVGLPTGEQQYAGRPVAASQRDVPRADQDILDTIAIKVTPSQQAHRLLLR